MLKKVWLHLYLIPFEQELPFNAERASVRCWSVLCVKANSLKTNWCQSFLYWYFTAANLANRWWSILWHMSWVFPWAKWLPPWFSIRRTCQLPGVVFLLIVHLLGQVGSQPRGRSRELSGMGRSLLGKKPNPNWKATWWERGGGAQQGSMMHKSLFCYREHWWIALKCLFVRLWHIGAVAQRRKGEVWKMLSAGCMLIFSSAEFSGWRRQARREGSPEQPGGTCCLPVLVQVRANVCLMPRSSSTRCWPIYEVSDRHLVSYPT